MNLFFYCNLQKKYFKTGHLRVSVHDPIFVLLNTYVTSLTQVLLSCVIMLSYFKFLLRTTILPTGFFCRDITVVLRINFLTLEPIVVLTLDDRRQTYDIKTVRNVPWPCLAHAELVLFHSRQNACIFCTYQFFVCKINVFSFYLSKRLLWI